MSREIKRGLRGKALAEQVPHLNGHQYEPRFIVFQQYWFYMIASAVLMGLIPVLKTVALIGILGTLFEASLWCFYFIKTGKVNGYPGLKAWLDIQLRRRLMGVGRSASRLGRPS